MYSVVMIFSSLEDKVAQVFELFTQVIIYQSFSNDT